VKEKKSFRPLCLEGNLLQKQKGKGYTFPSLGIFEAILTDNPLRFRKLQGFSPPGRNNPLVREI
jgi:hypothetical protein